LSPHDPFLSQFEAMLAGSQLALRSCDTAVTIARHAIRRPRVSIWAFVFLASALAHLGRLDEAHQAIDGLLDLKPDFTVADLDKFAPNADRAHIRYLVEGLRIAGLDRSDGAPADG
jgi:adenylate cyclase